MSNRVRQVTILVFAALASAGHLYAQALPPGSPTDAEQAAYVELQQTQQQLGQLQVQAINEHEELEAHRSSIDNMLLAAMTELDPNTQQNIDRLDVLSEQAITAQQAQDFAMLETLMTEATQLRTALETAQSDALQSEEIQAEIQRFDDALMAAVLEIDSGAEALRDRIDELNAQLGFVGPGGG